MYVIGYVRRRRRKTGGILSICVGRESVVRDMPCFLLRVPEKQWQMVATKADVLKLSDKFQINKLAGHSPDSL